MDLTQLFPVIATIGAFVVVLAIFYAVRILLNPERTAQDRVKELTGRSPESDSILVNQQSGSGVTWRVGNLARPQDETSAEELRRKLMQGGYRSHNALEVFSAVRAFLGLGLPVLAWLMLPALQLVYTAFFVMLAAGIGYYTPGIFLKSRIGSRQERLMRSFPDSLDLLVSSVEAGLGLDAAFRRVADEMEKAAPDLAHELQLVNHEVAAGVPRTEALRHLDKRTGLSEINSLVNVLIQAERFGTSVARALRIHSELVRKKRMLAAEERAAGASPKLTVVMILCIFPALFIVLVGPAVISVIRQLIPTLGGQ